MISVIVRGGGAIGASVIAAGTCLASSTNMVL
jgi:hypothetical protein